MESSSSIITFDQLPPLHCSLPLKCHPDYEVVKELCDSWLLSFLPPTSHLAPLKKQLIIRSRFPLFSCLTFVDCLSSRLPLVAKFISWLFLWDDFSDSKSLGADTALGDDRFECVVRILEGSVWEENVTLQEGVPGLLHAFVDWWNAICEDMPAAQTARFVEAMKDAIGGLKFQLRCRSEKRILDLQTYIEKRRQASFSVPVLILLEYALGLELDEETLQNAAWRRLMLAAVDHISWANDVLSCLREMSDGDFFNLPWVICCSNSNNSKKSFRDSLKEACGMVAEVEATFVKLSGEVKRSKMVEARPELSGFVEGLGYLMAGNLHWCTVTSRYEQHAIVDSFGVV